MRHPISFLHQEQLFTLALSRHDIYYVLLNDIQIIDCAELDPLWIESSSA